MLSLLLLGADKIMKTAVVPGNINSFTLGPSGTTTALFAPDTSIDPYRDPGPPPQTPSATDGPGHELYEWSSGVAIHVSALMGKDVLVPDSRLQAAACLSVSSCTNGIKPRATTRASCREGEELHSGEAAQ